MRGEDKKVRQERIAQVGQRMQFLHFLFLLQLFLLCIFL